MRKFLGYLPIFFVFPKIFDLPKDWHIQKKYEYRVNLSGFAVALPDLRLINSTLIQY